MMKDLASQARDFLVVFGNSPEITCKTLGIDNVDDLKSLVTSAYPEENWDEVFSEKIDDAKNYRMIAGLVPEEKEIINFLRSKDMKYLIISGKMNSGKTTLLHYCLDAENRGFRYIENLSEFISKNKWAQPSYDDIIYIIDNVDKNVHHATRGKLYKLVENRMLVEKTIVIMHEANPSVSRYFDASIGMKSPTTTEISSFARDFYHDDVKSRTDDELSSMFREVGQDVHHFIEYIRTGEIPVDKILNPKTAPLAIVKMIFGEKNREALRVKIGDLIHPGGRKMPKNLEGKVFDYFYKIKPVILQNLPYFYDPLSEIFYHNCRILMDIDGFIKKNGYITKEYLCDKLAYSFARSSKNFGVKAPVFIKKFDKKETKKEEDDEELDDG